MPGWDEDYYDGGDDVAYYENAKAEKDERLRQERQREEARMRKQDEETISEKAFLRRLRQEHKRARMLDRIYDRMIKS